MPVLQVTIKSELNLLQFRQLTVCCRSRYLPQTSRSQPSSFRATGRHADKTGPHSRNCYLRQRVTFARDQAASTVPRMWRTDDHHPARWPWWCRCRCRQGPPTQMRYVRIPASGHRIHLDTNPFATTAPHKTSSLKIAHSTRGRSSTLSRLSQTRRC